LKTTVTVLETQSKRKELKKKIANNKETIEKLIDDTVKWIDTQAWAAYVKYVVLVACAIILLTVVGSIMDRGKLDGSYQSQVRNLEAELARNLGIANLALLIFLNRYFVLLKKFNLTELKFAALSKMAGQNSTAATSFLTEKSKLEEEIAKDESTSEEVPDYMVSAASAAKAPPITASASKPKEVEVDEFGLPKVPARKLEA